MLATLRQRNFALLWFAGLISLAGDWMLMIALPIFVYQLTGSAVATSAILIAKRLPGLLFGSMAGVFVDRWDRRRTMVVANLLMALALLPLVAVRSAEQLWIVFVVAFVESTIAEFFGPAENALLPQLVGEQHLVAANSLNILNNNLARLIGPAVGGLAAALLGIGGVALLDAASFVIAAGLVAAIGGQYRPAAGEHAAAGAWGRLGREWLAGLRVIRRSRPVAVIFALIAITSLGEGVFGVMLVLFVDHTLGGGARELGWLMSAQAVGGIAGALLAGRFGAAVRPALLIGVGGVLFGLIDLAIFNYPALYPGIRLGVLLFAVVGVPGVAMFTGVNVLLQGAVPDQYRGRVFGTYSTTGALLGLAGTALAGQLGDRVPVVLVLNIQGFVYIVAGMLVLALLRGYATAAPAPDLRAADLA